MLPKVPGIKAKRVLLLGVGDNEALNARDFIKAANAAASAIKSSGADQACFCLNDLEVSGQDRAWQAEQTYIACDNALYLFDQTKSEPARQADDYQPAISHIDFLCDEGHEASIQQALSKGQAVALGISTAKDLGNMPANICTPNYLAEQAIALAEQHEAIDTHIIDEAELEKMGAGAFVAISKGSSESGKFIIMNYRGASDKEAAPHLILGKGITFDTGGISLKPGAGMDEMKFDMCGAASVLGTMTALAELKPNLNIIGMITAAENMPAANACKPGDVVTSLSGKIHRSPSTPTPKAAWCCAMHSPTPSTI